MSRRQLKADDSDGFLLAVWDDLAETSQMYHVEIEILVQPSLKRGQYEFVARAYKRPRGPESAPWAEGRYPYPTHAANTLAAALYRVAIRIGGECASVHRRLFGYDSLPAREEPAE